MNYYDSSNDYTPMCGRKIFKGVAYANDHTFVKLDDKVYNFYNDPDDGYRSYGVMQGEAEYEDYKDLDFNLEHTPIEVDVEHVSYDKDSNFEGIQIWGSAGLDSRTGEPICCLGTDNMDDYYPCAIDSFSAEEATRVRQLQFRYISEKILLDNEQ